MLGADPVPPQAPVCAPAHRLPARLAVRVLRHRLPLTVRACTRRGRFRSPLRHDLLVVTLEEAAPRAQRSQRALRVL
eukprot:9479731-Pyramimonas_sp.AAC.1